MKLDWESIALLLLFLFGILAQASQSETIQLIPNSTHKAYYVSSTTTDLPEQATTEFTSAQYEYISTSNDVYVNSTAVETISASCNPPTGDSYCYQEAEGSCEPCTPVGTCSAPSPHCNAPTQTNLRTDTCTWNLEATCRCVARGTLCFGTACGVTGGSCTYTCTSGYYDADGTDSNGCESTTPSYIFTFQRYTFNLSAFNWNDITQLNFCWEGKYNSTGGSYSSNLLWYNTQTSSWVSWQTLPYNSENTYCAVFDASNKSLVYNSTSGLVQFAVRGNQSKTGDTLTIYADFAYVNVTYGEAPPSEKYPVMDVSDPLYCSVPSLIPLMDVQILCMPKSNMTGQPITGATITCGAYATSNWGAIQTASSMTEQTNGVYNWTFLSGNMVAGNCYIINCTTAINGVNNGFGGTLCVLPHFATYSNLTNVHIGVTDVLPLAIVISIAVLILFFVFLTYSVENQPLKLLFLLTSLILIAPFGMLMHSLLERGTVGVTSMYFNTTENSTIFYYAPVVNYTTEVSVIDTLTQASSYIVYITIAIIFVLFIMNIFKKW